MCQPTKLRERRDEFPLVNVAGVVAVEAAEAARPVVDVVPQGREFRKADGAVIVAVEHS